MNIPGQARRWRFPTSRLREAAYRRHLYFPLARFSSTSSLSNAIKLRPYQEEAIQAILENVSNGKHRLGLSLATGAGKTVIFSQLIGRLISQRPEATKTLILVHRRELVDQAARHCRNAYPDKTVEIEMGSFEASGSADITVASILSLSRRLKRYDPAKFKLILVDEAHHIVAPSYLDALKHFGLIANDGPLQADEPPREIKTYEGAPVLVGVSATLSRFDGQSLGHAIDYIVYHKDYIDLIDEKWLCDVIFSTTKSGADLSKVKINHGQGGDFAPGPLSKAVNKASINETTIKSWLKKAKGRKSTLGFCVDVAHVEALTATFRRRGIDARYVTGKTAPALRLQLVDQFRKGEYPVLLNVGVFTEGTDIPNIDCVLLARPTRSRNLLVQMIGRGMRLSSDKKDCHVIDMVAALQTGIVTVPTLFGLDPTVLLDMAGTKEIERQKKEPPESLQYVDDKLPDHVVAKLRQADTKFTFRDYNSIKDLINETPESAHIRRLSNNAWVHVEPAAEGYERHILIGHDRCRLTIRNYGTNAPGREQPFHVTENTVVERDNELKRVFARPRVIAKCTTFEDAIHAADTYAANNRSYPRILTDRYEDWRRRPPSPNMLKLLEKLLPEHTRKGYKDTTAGECADMITKLKHGAKSKIKQAKADLDKSKRTEDRINTMRERERVRVGPLNGRLRPENSVFS